MSVRPTQEAIEARVNAATEGPWRHVTHAEDDWRYESVADDRGHEVCNSEECFTPEDERANFAFIAHAREDVPFLLGRVRELEDALRVRNEIILGLHDEVCGCIDPGNPSKCVMDEYAVAVSPERTSGPEPACPGCGLTSQVAPSRKHPGQWMCHGCARLFGGPEGDTT